MDQFDYNTFHRKSGLTLVGLKAYLTAVVASLSGGNSDRNDSEGDAIRDVDDLWSLQLEDGPVYAPAQPQGVQGAGKGRLEGIRTTGHRVQEEQAGGKRTPWRQVL